MPGSRSVWLTVAFLAWAGTVAGKAAAQSVLWFNSLHLVDVVPPDIHGHAGRVWPASLSTRGARVLDELARRGLTVESLFEQPALVASVVLAGIEDRVPVIPTEEYFYFEILYDGVWIAGNLRTTEASQGVLHCGYYMRHDPRRSRYAPLSAADGVCVSERASSGGREVYIVDEKSGASATFEVLDAAGLPFRDAMPLRAGESVVSPVIDESGTAFLLLYDLVTCTFAYVHAASPADDPLVPLDEPGGWQGRASGFVYAEDSWGRLVLAGVRRDEIAMNTFYDGPFDQVPPRLALRDLLRWAYPGIEARRADTLDPHGNWLGQAGSRVAIVPYLDYDIGDEARSVAWARREEARRHASSEVAVAPTAPDDAWLRRFAGVVRAHARDWAPTHSLRTSADEEHRRSPASLE